MMSSMRLSIIALLSVLLAVGCGSQEGSSSPETLVTEPLQDTLLVEDAWARPGPQGGMSAAYFEIENRTGAADTLLSAASPVAELVELHESYEREGGMRGMRKIPPIPIPSEGEVALAPGGKHVMLIRLTHPLAQSDSVALVLTFARHGPRLLTLPVRPLADSTVPEAQESTD